VDHGVFYAGTLFWDPRTHQQVVFGWVLEEDLSLELRRAQGWAGVITLPRVLRVAMLRYVVGALVSPLRSIGCVELIPEDSDESRFTVVTLCAVPDARLRKLRGVRMCLPWASVSRRADSCYSLDFPQPYAHWEMRLLFAVGPDASRLGFNIIHSPSTQNPQKGEQVNDANHLVAGEKTTAVMADRSKSSSVPSIQRFIARSSPSRSPTQPEQRRYTADQTGGAEIPGIVRE
jgi:beta-fructofuranosidase